METLSHNKYFIKASLVLVTLLSLFVLALFVNAVKKMPYVGYAGNGSVPSISVSGTGNATGVSDIATLSINVTKDASTSAEAQKNLNDMVAKTVDYLKSQNIDDKDIKSEYGGISPRYTTTSVQCFAYPCPQPASKITGYTATQMITVKVRAVDSANEIRTGLADLGLTDISGPTFTIDDPEGLQDQARAAAIEDAREHAETLAAELHVHLGKVISFSENGGGAYPMAYMAKDMAMSSASSAPVLPKGENKITSNVSIVYEIR